MLHQIEQQTVIMTELAWKMLSHHVLAVVRQQAATHGS
jgi:hypothetical protein